MGDGGGGGGGGGFVPQSINKKLSEPGMSKLSGLVEGGNKLSGYSGFTPLSRGGNYHSGMPQAPKRQSLLDPVTGQLMDQYQYKPQAFTGPTGYSMEGAQGFGQLQKMASTPSTESDWYKAQSQALDVSQKQMFENAARSGADIQGQMLRGLGTTGGYSSGARERAMKAGALGAAQARQQAGMLGEQQKAGLGTQAEQMRLQAVGQLAPMEAQQRMFGAQQDFQKGMYNVGQQNMAQQGNIAGAMGEHGADFGSQMAGWQEQMKAWAANKQAGATEKSGGSKKPWG